MSVDFPSDAVVIRFGVSTPYWPLSMSYGLFHCPQLRRNFHSPDQFIAFRMLARPEDRARVAKTPNGYLAHTNLVSILEGAISVSGNPAVVPDWENGGAEAAMRECLTLKFSQSAMLADMLLRTGTRPIYDDSRADEPLWCWAGGKGKNMHAMLMTEVRTKLASGELLPMVARQASR